MSLFFCNSFPSYTTNVHLLIHCCKYCMWNSWWVLYIIFVQLKFIVTILGKTHRRWKLLCGNDNWWSDKIFPLIIWIPSYVWKWKDKHFLRVVLLIHRYSQKGIFPAILAICLHDPNLSFKIFHQCRYVLGSSITVVRNCLTKLTIFGGTKSCPCQFPP